MGNRAVIRYVYRSFFVCETLNFSQCRDEWHSFQYFQNIDDYLLCVSVYEYNTMTNPKFRFI